MNRLSFFLVSTDHLTDRIWFKDDEDFRIGMNYVAILAAKSGVRVLAFILMSNHVHFVLEGDPAEVDAFINEFKRRYSMYYRHKYGSAEFLRRNSVDIKPVGLEDESLERAIAYVQMNSVAANICAHASLYPWGSGSAFFNSGLTLGKAPSAYSGRMLCKMMHSNESVPDTLRINERGYVEPASFVAVRFVEKLFRTPARYSFFLSNSSKARARMQGPALPAFRDQCIQAAVSDLCNTLFRKPSFQELAQDADKGEILRQLRYRFSADISQLSRTVGLPYDETVRLLDLF